MGLAQKNNSNLQVHRSRLDERLTYMKSLALAMGACVEETLADTKLILMQRKRLDDLSKGITEREEKINDLQLQLSKSCFRALARQAPVAKDLRMVLTVLNASTDLERMGDLSINIAHRFHTLQSHPSLNQYYALLEQMFESTIQMVRLALDAFVKEDVIMSQQVLGMDDIVDSSLTTLRKESKELMAKHTEFIPTCVECIIIASGLERIADHSTNIAEEIIFLETGKDIRHTSS